MRGGWEGHDPQVPIFNEAVRARRVEVAVIWLNEYFPKDIMRLDSLHSFTRLEIKIQVRWSRNRRK